MAFGVTALSGGGRISKGNGLRVCSCAQGGLSSSAPAHRAVETASPPRESNCSEEFRSCHHARLGVSECPRAQTGGRSGRLDARHVVNCAWAQRGAAVTKRAPFRPPSSVPFMEGTRARGRPRRRGGVFFTRQSPYPACSSACPLHVLCMLTRDICAKSNHKQLLSLGSARL